MNPFRQATAAVMSGLQAQATRLRIVSENLANADTHGYRRKLVSFDAIFDRKTGAERIEVGPVRLDPAPLAETFDPTHPFADARGYVAGSNVNMMTEFADAREAGRSYEAGLEAFRQARDMYGALLDILKR